VTYPDGREEEFDNMQAAMQAAANGKGRVTRLNEVKKKSDNTEIKEPESARTQRIMSQMRARQPQASTDTEAMLYDFMAAQKRDRKDIERLDKERQDLEKEVKQDLEKDIADLKKRRTARADLSKVQAKNQDQDRAIDRLSQIQKQLNQLDQEQQQEIENLEKAVATTAYRPSGAAATAQPAQPAQQPAQTSTDNGQRFCRMVQQLAPGRVIRGRNQTAQQQQPASQAPQGADPATLRRLNQLGALGLPGQSANAPVMKDVAEEVAPGDLEAISQHNSKAFTNAYAYSQSAKLYFGDGRWEDLTFEEIERIVSAIATDYTEQTRPKVWQQLFTDYDYFQDFKKQHLSQLPLQFKESRNSRPNNLDLWNRAKSTAQSKFDVYPSAQADSWAAKWYNARGGTWGKI
jgi:chromosome segregation ATPase